MKPTTKFMPLAAALTALSTLACCLPFSLAAAFGIGGLGILLEPYRGWLIAVSVVLLGTGIFELYRFRLTCRKNSRSGILVLVLAVIIVVGVALFPQAIAVVLADLLQ
jgi:hypothetical protein